MILDLNPGQNSTPCATVAACHHMYHSPLMNGVPKTTFKLLIW